MTDHSAATVAGITPAPGAKLEPDAIGAAQDTIIGMASSAPAATVGLSLAALAVATAYGSGPILILTAIPMLIIANAYRRCNLWNANCGASFEWVGRAINPYLGFLTGWLMIAAYIIGTVAEVLILGPSVLAVFGSSSTNNWALHRHRRRHGPHHAGDRGHRHQDHGPRPGQHGHGRVPDPDRAGHRRPGLGAGSPPRLGAHHPGLVQPQRRQRQGRRRGRVPGRRVRLRRLGRHPVRQRGSQAPPGQPGPRRDPGRRPAGHHLHAGAGRFPGRALARQAPGRLGQRHRAGRRGPARWAARSGPRRWRCRSRCP